MAKEKVASSRRRTGSKKDSDGDEKGSSGLSTTKMMVIFAIIVACFATLYPRFFHPIISNMFGGNRDSSKSHNTGSMDDVPPSVRSRMGDRHPGHSERPMGGGGGPHGGPRGMHPGMRYGGGESTSSRDKGGGGGRGGMVGTILPVYAVGIVCYLVYTLFKVFGKKKDSKKKRRRLTDDDDDDSASEQRSRKRRGSDDESEEDRSGSDNDSKKEDEEEDEDASGGSDADDDKPDTKAKKSKSKKKKQDDDEDEEEEQEDDDSEAEKEKAAKAVTVVKAKAKASKDKAKKTKEKCRELEELLLRADEGELSLEELHRLQSRLSDTESQLGKILKTMHKLDASVEAIAGTAAEQSPKAEEVKSKKDDESVQQKPGKENDSEDTSTVRQRTANKGNKKPQKDKEGSAKSAGSGKEPAARQEDNPKSD